VLEAPKQDSVAEHLQRIAVIASSAFAVGSAAIAVLTAGRARTLAAVGPALGDQACVRAAAVRPMLVLDAWHDTHLARDVRPRGEIRFFAAHPLELDNGAAMGTLSVFDTEPRTADEFDAEVLRDLAVLASAELQYAGAVV
jgi:GAF domain-containing protein